MSHYNNSKAEEPIDEESSSSSDGKKKAEEVQQWTVHDAGISFVPCNQTIREVPAGIYRINYSNQRGYYLNKNNEVLSDNVLQLPIPACEEIISDIESFWELKDQFVKYRMVYKRGILVYGPPGCGKSYMMQTIISNLVKRNGVVIVVNTVGDMENFVSFIQRFRTIEPNRPVIVIFEDIDNIIEGGQNMISALLNILDGVNQIDNVVYLATTNYPEKLQERMSNRPSRFDRVYHIDLPNAEVRRFYVQHKVDSTDIKGIDVDKWTEETEGLSLSHIKELIVSVVILKKKFEDVMLHFKDMKKPKSSRGSTEKVGFGLKG